MSTSPTPFVVPPGDEGELTEDATQADEGAEDSAEADRAASYGEDTPTTGETREDAENSAEADRRASMPKND
jgi:hypothetical protein